MEEIFIHNLYSLFLKGHDDNCAQNTSAEYIPVATGRAIISWPVMAVLFAVDLCLSRPKCRTKLRVPREKKTVSDQWFLRKIYS